MKGKISLEITAFLFILLFMYAALTKLEDYQKFKAQIGQSPLLTGFGESIPWLVILLEIVLSILLMLPRFRLMAFFCAFSMMTMFTIYILAILNFSPYVPCSCGGVLEMLGWKEHLFFNLTFVLLSLIGILLESRRKEDIAARPDRTIQG